MRYYKVTDDLKKQLHKNLEQHFKKCNGQVPRDGKIPLDWVPPKQDTLQIKINQILFGQLKYVVASCSKEVAMLFTTTFNRKEKEIIIKDMYIPPQLVSGASVETDDERYGAWLNELPMEVINKLNCEVHSHVNFTASPSAQDEGNWPKILTNVKDYYVFIITNKKGECYIRVYDIKNNIVYDNQDIEFIQTIDAKEYIKELLDKQLKDGGKQYGFNKSDADEYGSIEHTNKLSRIRSNW